MTDYRVDELARAADTSVRNVRVYQDRGLLPPPRRVGRTGIYNDAHLARLRLIRLLLQRGYTFATIGELLSAYNQGQNIEDLLLKDGLIGVGWSDEEPGRLAVDDLVAAFGAFDEKDLERAVAMGFVGADDDGFHVPSPKLLEAGANLVKAGVPLPAVLDLAEGLSEQLTQVAQLIFRAFSTFAVEGRTSAEVAEEVTRLRPFAQQAVDALLALAMARELERMIGMRARKAKAEASASEPGSDDVSATDSMTESA